MTRIISYCKKQILWFFLFLFCIMTFSLILYLNGISAKEIIYGNFLCIFFFFLFIGYDLYKYYQKINKLERIKKSIRIEIKDLPDATDLVESDYQELLELIHLDKVERLNEADSKRKDMMEYYSMWVHQIKTPIAAMHLLLQSMEKEMEGNVCSESKKEVDDELFRIEQYVGMALQYLRIDGDSNDFLFEEQELDKIIREAVHKYAKLFIRKKISLHYESVDQLVITDEKWLEFVIEQILSNAIKYTQTGSVSIYIEKEDCNDRKECIEKEDGNVEKECIEKTGCEQKNRSLELPEMKYLVIEDTGIGIRAEDLPRVFEKGYTGYNGHSDKRSSGIGLYLCSRVLKKLGHTIEITSQVGKGTRVKIGFCMKRHSE